MPERALSTPESLWMVETEPPVQGDAAWIARLLDRTRGLLLQAQEASPKQEQFRFPAGLLLVRVRRLSGPANPGSPVRLSFRPAPSAAPTGIAGAGKAADLPRLELPHPALAELDSRLVGVESVRDELLQHLDSRWSGGLDQWAARRGCALPPGLRSHLESTAPLFVLAGPPGTGKTALAQAVADRFCRERGLAGLLLQAGTDLLRGDGLVGSLGSFVRSATGAARAAARSGPTFLLINEAEAVGMRRSERQAHHEDRAGTAALLQCLDEIALDRLPLAVFLTTNLLQELDQALLRRGSVYRVERPAAGARTELLKRWLPGLTACGIIRAARAAEGMTPNDIERELTRQYLDAARRDAPLTVAGIVGGLRHAVRTGEV